MEAHQSGNQPPLSLITRTSEQHADAWLFLHRALASSAVDVTDSTPRLYVRWRFVEWETGSGIVVVRRSNAMLGAITLDYGGP